MKLPIQTPSRHGRVLALMAAGAAAGGLIAGLWGWGVFGLGFAMVVGVTLALACCGALDDGRRLRARPSSVLGLLATLALPCALVGHAMGSLLRVAG
jgi:hypothetical protein